MPRAALLASSTKLQELSIGSDKKAPIRKVRVSEFFNRPIETQAELEKALELIRDSLQKCIDEGDARRNAATPANDPRLFQTRLLICLQENF